MIPLDIKSRTTPEQPSLNETITVMTMKFVSNTPHTLHTHKSMRFLTLKIELLTAHLVI